MRREDTSGSARILACYEIDLCESFERARRDIAGIAYWHANDVEDSTRVWRRILIQALRTHFGPRHAGMLTGPAYPP